MNKECCDKCWYVYPQGVARCTKPACECHKEERQQKLQEGAKDFAERFEPVMRELAEEEISSLAAFEHWLEHENEDTGGEVGQIDIIEKVEELLASTKEAIAKEIETMFQKGDTLDVIWKNISDLLKR